MEIHDFSYWKEPNFRPQYHSLQGHMNEKLHGLHTGKEPFVQ